MKWNCIFDTYFSFTCCFVSGCTAE